MSHRKSSHLHVLCIISFIIEKKNVDIKLSFWYHKHFWPDFSCCFPKKNTIWTGKLAVKTWLVSLTNDYTYFVWLTHRPTTHLHPMIQDSSHECERTRAPLNIVHRFIQAPSSTTTSGPIVTLGPILQFLPILAVGSCIQSKTLLYCTLCQIKNLYFKFCVLFYGHSSSKYLRVYIKMAKIPKSTHYLLNHNLNQYT